MKYKIGIVLWILGMVMISFGLGELIVSKVISDMCVSETPIKKQYRFLLSLSSFKRPILLSGQILRFMNQDYPHFDLSVSIKGVENATVINTLMREWKPYIAQGRLRVRFDANKDQFSNLLDGVRDYDLNQYDYVCKIDDDDWYAPDYLTSINDSLNETGPASITSSRNALLLYRQNGKTTLRRNFTSLSGPSMCFSVEVIQESLKIEQDPRYAEKWFDKNYAESFFSIREDNFLHQFARKIGVATERDKGEPKMIFGQQFPSVMRNRDYIR